MEVPVSRRGARTRRASPWVAVPPRPVPAHQDPEPPLREVGARQGRAADVTEPPRLPPHLGHRRHLVQELQLRLLRDGDACRGTAPPVSPGSLRGQPREWPRHRHRLPLTAVIRGQRQLLQPRPGNRDRAGTCGTQRGGRGGHGGTRGASPVPTSPQATPAQPGAPPGTSPVSALPPPARAFPPGSRPSEPPPSAGRALGAALTSPGPERPRRPPSPHRRKCRKGAAIGPVTNTPRPWSGWETRRGMLVPEGNAARSVPTPRPGRGRGRGRPPRVPREPLPWPGCAPGLCAGPVHWFYGDRVHIRPNSCHSAGFGFGMGDLGP